MTTTASGPAWTDVLTAVGTVGLASLAALTIVVTALLAKQQRNGAEIRLREERELADRALRNERNAAAERLKDERDHAERMRLRERQTFAAAALLDRIAEFQFGAGKIVDANRIVPGL